MDTLENNNGFFDDEQNEQPELQAADIPDMEPATEPESAAEEISFEAAPEQEPQWEQPRQEQPVPPPYGYYPPQYQQPVPPQYGYYPPRYQQPAPQQGYYPPRPQQTSQPSYYQPRYQQSAWAAPGTRQNAYVPSDSEAPKVSAEPAAASAPKAKKKKKGGFWKRFVAAVLILALVAGSCCATAMYVNDYWEKRTDEMNAGFAAQIEGLQRQIDANSHASDGTSISGSYAPVGEGLTPAQVYAQNVKSVVAITCTVTTSYYGQTSTGTSSGSGFILTGDGYVVTNFHVIEGATSVTVTTNDGTNYTAAIIGGDSTNDIAVLKVEGNNLPAVTIGSSSALIVGDQVAAVGNALGELTNSLTVGYISAKDRMVTTDGFAINMLQTDTAINSGNSGGPLFNMYGQVVGITTAKYSGASSSGASIEGIGFAIPIDDVLGMIEDLISQGYIGGAYLGVSVSDMNAEAADYYGLPVGAYVQEVTLGGAAQRAGVQAKDIIVALGEHQINGVTSLTRALRNFSAGDTTTITVYRGGEKLELSITLDAKPEG